MTKYKIENVHISLIKPGDAILHEGKIITVNKEYIKNDSFMGISLYGDSYKLGYKPVKRLINK